MNFSKRKIVLDFDDTLFKSSERVIDILNKKYHLHKTIDDLSDWGYKSIYPQITDEMVTEIYGSKEFFDIKTTLLKYLNTGILDFLEYASKKYQIVICTKGDENNLKNKKEFCDFISCYLGRDYEFIGIRTDESTEGYKLDKSMYDFSDCLFAVDDNTNALESLNVPVKFLIKNGRETYWNKTPINSNIYVINTFEEMLEICQFDEQLRDKGEIIG